MARMPERVREHFATLNALLNERRERKRRADREAVEYVRGAAAVALDAFLSERPQDTEELGALLRFALIDYKLHYPRSQGDNLWRTHVLSSNMGRHYERRSDGSWTGRINRGARYSDPKVAVCRFCSVELQPARMGMTTEWLTTAARDHTIQCALESLCGLRQPTPPATYSVADPTP